MIRWFEGREPLPPLLVTDRQGELYDDIAPAAAKGLE